jgi:hypothetical protein
MEIVMTQETKEAPKRIVEPNIIPAGSYLARGTSMEVGAVGANETEVCRVVFTFEDGPAKGRTIEWFGWLNSDANSMRTAESLALCGYKNKDPGTIGRNMVQLVIEHEENVSEKNGNTYVKARVRYVNDPERGRMNFVPMPAAQKVSALDRLNGLVAEVHQKRPAGASPDKSSSFAFGANAPQGAGSPAQEPASAVAAPVNGGTPAAAPAATAPTATGKKMF